jgi:hypothetical protein
MMLCGLAAASLMLPACATVTRGTKETFNIVTTPTAADVSLSTGQTCVSPCKLKLKRKNAFTVTAKKPGYQNATASVRSVVKGGGVAGAAGNILIGGVIGGIVDGSNGSMKDLTPNPLNLTLQPVVMVVEAPVAPAVEATAVAAPEAAPAAEAVPAVEAAPATDAAPSASPSAGE